MKSNNAARKTTGAVTLSALLCFALAGLCPIAAHAQDDTTDPPETDVPVKAPPLEVTAIVGGDLWTVTKGVIHNGTILIKGGKIDQIGGPELMVPAGAKIIDAKGMAVSPGFIVTNAQLQLGNLAAGSKIKDSLDPYALAVELALASGVTSAYLSGTPGFVPGQGIPPGFGGGGGGGGVDSSNAVIKMSAGDATGMLAAESVLSTFGGGGGRGRFGGTTGMSARWSLRDQFRRAKEYQQKLDANEADKKAGKKVTEPRKPADADAVLPLIRKERALRITASDVGDIRWALSLVDAFGIREVITPATEAWIVADDIAKRNVMVIITARSRTAPDDRKNAPSGANPDAPGILQKAGVHFAVLPLDASFAIGGELGRDLLNYPLEAAFAMRGGADSQAAFESITLTPAKILGLETRLGSLEAGKDADIVILSGEPLDYRSFVEKTFVNGKLLYDRSKSTFFSQIQPQKGVPTLPPMP